MKTNLKFKIIWFFLLIWMIIMLLITITSCKVMKSAKSDSSLKDTSHTIVQKKDSTTGQEKGSVSKDEKKSNEEADWWKKTLDYKGQQTPQVIIYEGGKSKKETSEINYDSIWDNRMQRLMTVFVDSMFAKQSRLQSETQKSTKVSWPLWATILIVLIGYTFLNFFLSKLKILNYVKTKV